MWWCVLHAQVTVNLTALTNALQQLNALNLTTLPNTPNPLLNATFVFTNSSVNISFPLQLFPNNTIVPPFIVLPLTPAAVDFLSPILNATALANPTPATITALNTITAVLSSQALTNALNGATGTTIQQRLPPINANCFDVPPAISALIPLQLCPQVSSVIGLVCGQRRGGRRRGRRTRL